MNLPCVNCGEPIPAKNINIQKTLALCDHCGTVFDFSENVSAEVATQKPKNRKIKQPLDMQVHEGDDQLLLRLKWSTRIVPPTINILMGIWLVLTIILPLLSALSGDFEALGWGFLLGFIPLYYFISLLVNSTRIELSNRTVSAVGKPLPWFDGKTINTERIETVTYKSSKSFEQFYDVYARLYDGREMNLVELIPYEHAVFIAQEANGYLRLFDENEEQDFEHLTDTPDILSERNTNHSEQAVKR